MGARRDADLALDRADLLGAASVGTTLVDRDLLTDEILVDRLGRTLHVLLRDRVLDRRLALFGRAADRERQRDLLDDAAEEDVALPRLELLRVLLGIGQDAELRLELRPDRDLDGREPFLLENDRERRSAPAAPARCPARWSPS